MSKKNIIKIASLTISLVLIIIIYIIITNNKEIKNNVIETKSFDGEVTFKIGDIEEDNIIESNTYVDSAMHLTFKNVNIFLDNHVLNNDYLQEKFEEDENLKAYLFKYENYYFLLRANIKDNFIYLNDFTKEFAIDYDDINDNNDFSDSQISKIPTYVRFISPIIDVHNKLYLQLENNKIYYDKYDEEISYQKIKEFYLKINQDIVQFNDEEEIINLKCSNINNVHLGHDNKEKAISENHPISLIFKDDHIEVEFDIKKWNSEY